MCVMLFLSMPSVMALTEYEDPDEYYLINCVIQDGNLNSLKYEDGIPLHIVKAYPGASCIQTIFYFDRPSISNGAGELKIVYDYTNAGGGAWKYLKLAVLYFDDPNSDHFTLYHGPWTDPPQYQTEIFPLRPNTDVDQILLTLWFPNDLWIDYLRVKYTSTGGGGCPILSVYDGSEYKEEGLLDIHDSDGNDVVYKHTLTTIPEEEYNRYLLKLTEHPKTISDIDQVKLLGLLPNGRKVRLPLLSAIHSTEGEVRSLVRFSDDHKATTLGADHNNGISQSIELEFLALKRLPFTDFIFVIEGNNAIVK
ncbi:MAG: hypothetical protein EU535_06345 [Promethearchaeota archaeon]|nr:MAG: hypothetical protein EU535_06345 [Candidatus Lokiarchaeota archaeon]